MTSQDTSISQKSQSVDQIATSRDGILSRLAVSPMLQVAVSFAAILGLVAGLLAIFVPVWLRDYKSIDIVQADRKALITRDPDAGTTSDLQILYKGNEVEAPWASTIIIKNSGTVPVRVNDIEQPITIDFNSATILAAELVETIPSGVEASVSCSKNVLAIQHKLFNPSDQIVINLILDGEPANVSAKGRIAGIPILTVENRSTGATDIGQPYWVPTRILGTIGMSFVSGFVGFWGVAFLIEICGDLDVVKSRRRSSDSLRRSLNRLLPRSLNLNRWETVPNDVVDTIHQLNGNALPVSWLDLPQTLDQFLQQERVRSSLKDINVTADDASIQVRTFMLQRIRRYVTMVLSSHLDQRPKIVEKIMSRIAMEPSQYSSLSDLIEKTIDLVRKEAPDIQQSSVIRKRAVLELVVATGLAVLATIAIGAAIYVGWSWVLS